MTPKTTIEEPIPGNSLSSRRQHAKIPHESKPITSQVPALKKATAIRTKNEN
jgi:hypothetical protein